MQPFAVWKLVLGSCLGFVICNLGFAADKEAAAPEIRMRPLDDDRVAFEVIGLDQAELDSLSKLKADSPQWTAIFAVFVYKSGSGSDVPAMLGTYRLDRKVLTFEPRFALTRGLSYRAVFDRSKISGAEAESQIEKVITIRKEVKAPSTVVEQVFPSASKLPENQLKFYLHFSASMSRGDVYRHVHLFDDKGKEVVMPFLELEQELWDPEGKRFTLFFDPGRIKRGVKPRDDLGPPLVAGRTYSLRIDRAWQDADGIPLKDDFVKKFTVTEPLAERIDSSHWKVQAPAADTTDTVTVQFPGPLDRALLHRMIWVTDAKGVRIAGTIKVTDDETRWHFEPAKPWTAGKYRLVIDTSLEDLAGNTLAAPFEVDVFKPIPKEPKVETKTLSFEVR